MNYDQYLARKSCGELNIVVPMCYLHLLFVYILIQYYAQGICVKLMLHLAAKKRDLLPVYCGNLLPVLRSRKYFFRLRLRGAVNPNYGSGSSCYTNIFAAFVLFYITNSFIACIENYLLRLDYLLTWTDKNFYRKKSLFYVFDKKIRKWNRNTLTRLRLQETI
jgi:hypothetical protein